MKRRIYLAGPMTGLPDLNYAAFHEAAQLLRAEGYEVASPAELTAPNQDPTWEDWMRAALALLLTCDGVALLPGWAQSRGACEEQRLASWVLRMDTLTVREWLTGEADR